MDRLDPSILQRKRVNKMCLGIPMKIVEKNGNVAVAEAGGIRKSIRLDLLAEADIGD